MMESVPVGLEGLLTWLEIDSGQRTRQTVGRMFLAPDNHTPPAPAFANVQIANVGGKPGYKFTCMCWPCGDDLAQNLEIPKSLDDVGVASEVDPWSCGGVGQLVEGSQEAVPCWHRKGGMLELASQGAEVGQGDPLAVDGRVKHFQNFGKFVRG